MWVLKEERKTRKEMALTSRHSVSQLDCMLMHLALRLTDGTES